MSGGVPGAQNGSAMRQGSAAMVRLLGWAYRLVAALITAVLLVENQITFFLRDEDSAWWQYHQDLMTTEYAGYPGLLTYETHADGVARYAEELKEYWMEIYPARYAGNEEQAAKDVANFLNETRHIVQYPDPGTMDGAMEIVEKAYEYGNQYESNPEYDGLVSLEIRKYHFNFENLPDGAELAIPRYVNRVYGTAYGLYNGDGMPAPQEAYQDHFRSLVFFANRYNSTAFVSYYFPTQDTQHLPSYK
jgi:hypothetical protein